MRNRRDWLPLLVPALVGIAGCTPLRPSTPTSTAVAAEKRGDYDEAIRQFTQTIAAPGITDGAKATAYNLRCVAYLNKAQYDNAISDCNEAIRLKPDLGEAYNNRAFAYTSKGQPDLAIADLDIAIGIRPNNETAYENRGNAYASKGQFDRAISDLSDAIHLKPDFEVAYYVRGRTYLYKDDIDRAIADETEAIRLNPKATGAYEIRSVAYSARRDFNDAFADIGSTIRLQPNGSRFYFDRGVIELEMERFADAATDLAASQKRTPDSLEPIIWLHLARAKTGGNDKSELEQSAAATDQTKWPSPILAMYRHQYEVDKLLEMTTRGGDTEVMRAFRCQIYFHVGEYNLLENKVAAAKPLLQKAVEICPSYVPEKIIANTELSKFGK